MTVCLFRPRLKSHTLEYRHILDEALFILDKDGNNRVDKAELERAISSGLLTSMSKIFQVGQSTVGAAFVGTHNTTKDAFIWFLKACKSSDQALVKAAFEQQLLDWVANHGQDMNAIAQQYIDWLGRWEQLDENSFVEESGECSINVQMLQAGRPQSGCLKVGLHFNNGKICGTGSAGTFLPVGGVER